MTPTIKTRATVPPMAVPIWYILTSAHEVFSSAYPEKKNKFSYKIGEPCASFSISLEKNGLKPESPM